MPVTNHRQAYGFPTLLYFNIVLLLVITAEGWKPRKFPKIGISEFAMQDEEEHHSWETEVENIPDGAMKITDNGQTYIITQPLLAMTIDCNASYPVQWLFANAEDASENVYSIKFRMLRTAKDVYNSLTNTFTSQLQLYGDTNAVSGEYTCVSTEYEDVRKTIYIFWQGGSASPLIPQEKSEDVCVKHDGTVVLPCRVAEPDARPKLYYEIKCNERYKLIDSPYIKYDAKIGFTIDTNQYNGAFGRYKCAMSDDDSFPAYFNLRNETCAPRIFNNTMASGASFRFSKKDQRIVCCSNSSRTPSIQAVFCFDPVSCKMKEFRLFKTGNNGVSFKNGSCAFERIYERDSGMIRCKGDGIDVTRPFYTDLQGNRNESFNLYFDWDQIQPQKLMSITVNTRKAIYDEQNLTLNCETSYFYFAEGLKWAIRWKNGSLEFLELDSGIYEQEKAASTFTYQTIRLPININMTEAVCFAPVWNTTEWVNKSYRLDVRESTPPTFKNMEVEVLYFNLNSTEQVINCTAEGTPSPLLRWRKNNRTLLNENNAGIKRKNGTLTLTIHRVSHETHGEYRCLASNVKGKFEKVFQVYVVDPGQPLSASAIAFVAVLVFILVGGMGFLLWRMQLQRKIINHLTGIVFRDMGGTSNNGTAPARSTNAVVVNTRPHQNGGMEFSSAQDIQESNHI